VSESERRQRTISSTPRLTPDEIAARSFPTAFRGISETDVRSFLKRIAEELGSVRGREQELLDTIEELEARLRTPRPLDEQELLDALGEETTRLLRSAREAAIDIRGKAEERAARLVHGAQEEAQRVRQEADEVLGVRTQEAESVARGLLEEAEQRATDLMRVADERTVETRAAADRYAEELQARAEHESVAEIERARERSAALLEEATGLRDRVIDDLSRRRELLTGQLEELRAGRDELLDAYRIVKRTFLEATDALAQVEARATAGRPVAVSDPADLTEARAAENDAARLAGVYPDSVPGPTLEPDAEPAGAEPGTADAGVAVVDLAAAEGSPSDDARIEDGRDGSAPNLADVDDLFARLRAGAQAEPESADPAASGADSGVVASEPVASERDGAPSDVTPGGDTPRPAAEGAADAASDDDTPAWFARRDAALAPLRGALVRQVKLAVGNEQNEVLDKVRRHKGRPAAASALPDVDAQIVAWSAVLVGPAAEAYRQARGAPPGDGPAVPDDLAATLARAMVEPLRDRLIATIDSAHEPGETSNQVAERIGARYREWKNRSAEASTDDALVAAYSRGRYDRAADGAVLTWSVPAGGCCVDCADNALEPTRKGETFPTGQAYPPAHPGCRCVLVNTESDSFAGSDLDVESTSQG
jgi:DivIVA domain-containing protein